MTKKLTDSKVNISGLESDNAELKAGQTDIKAQNEYIKLQNDDTKSKNDALLDGQTDIEAKVDRLEVQNASIILFCTGIQSDTTILKSDTSTIIDDTKYIINTDTGGLLAATKGSISYYVAELDRHAHSYERFFELANTPSGELHVADELGSGNGPFQLSCGSNVFGSWVQIFGSNDTPFIAGMALYDFHEVQIEEAQRADTYILQISFGETGDQGITNGTYSTRPYTPQSTLIDSSSLLTQARRQTAGTKVWMRGMVRGLAGTISIYPGFHEYEK